MNNFFKNSNFIDKIMFVLFIIISIIAILLWVTRLFEPISVWYPLIFNFLQLSYLLSKKFNII